jgi:hypothetical protein
MNRLILKRFRMLLLFLAIFSTVSFSQFDNVDFLRSAPADAVNYVQAYFSPFAKAFGAGLNGSWYNTAKPHKLGGFDLTFGVNVGVVPSSAENFDLATLKLAPANYAPTTGMVPTIAGQDKSGPSVTYSQSGYQLATFSTPPGTGWKYLPVPTLQAGIGLPMGTELKVRYIPTIDIKGGDIGLWGVGLMHSIMQYIPGNELLPIDVSIFAGYTKLTGNVPLGLKPQSGYPSTITLPIDNQNLNVTIDALNVSAIASVSIPVLTVYGGLGYSKTNTNIKLSGNFPTPKLYGTSVEYRDDGIKKGETFPKIDIKDFSGMRANIGLRVKFAVITIHADYTRAQYNVFSTGLGISFR